MKAILENGKEIEINDSERTPCEIWTRVMGYYRPVSEFNIGKRSEHAERKLYIQSKIMSHFEDDVADKFAAS